MPRRHSESDCYFESINRRDGSANLVEQGTSAMLGAPMVNVVPVESGVALDGEDVADIIGVLAPLGDICPAKFHDDHVLRHGDSDFSSDLFRVDRAALSKTGLVVGILTQQEKFDFKGQGGDAQMVAHRARDHFKTALFVEHKLGRKFRCRSEQGSGIDGEDDVGILGGAGYAVSITGDAADDHVVNVEFPKFFDDSPSCFIHVLHGRSSGSEWAVKTVVGELPQATHSLSQDVIDLLLIIDVKLGANPVFHETHSALRQLQAGLDSFNHRQLPSTPNFVGVNRVGQRLNVLVHRRAA